MTINGNKTFSGVTAITNTTAASSTTTGALQVAGGMSCQGNAYANTYTSYHPTYPQFLAQCTGLGGNASLFLMASSDNTNTGYLTMASSGQLQINTNNVTGSVQVSAGTTTLTTSYNGTVTSNSQVVISATTNQLKLGGTNNVVITSPSLQNLHITGHWSKQLIRNDRPSTNDQRCQNTIRHHHY
jgi:hypothetical protein